MTTNQTLEEEIGLLEQEIQRLKASLPAHSVPPSMLIRLEDLEDQLAELTARRDQGR